MTIKEEYIITRQGKKMALYIGLLDAAHEAGLVSIEAELWQAPSKDNDMTAIAEATVTMANGQVFSDIGDANPANVGSSIKPHIIRMASTRAKARALRDALNAAVAVDEADDEEENEAHVRQLPPKLPGKITGAQWTELSALGKAKLGYDGEQLANDLKHEFGVASVKDMTSDQVALAMQKLQSLPAKPVETESQEPVSKDAVRRQINAIVPKLVAAGITLKPPGAAATIETMQKWLSEANAALA